MILNRLKTNKIFFLITTVLITLTLVYFLVIRKSTVEENYGDNFSIIYTGSITESSESIKNQYQVYLKEAAEFWDKMLLEENRIKINVKMFAEKPTEYYTVLAKGSVFSRTKLKEGGYLLINSEAESKNWTDVFKHEIAHIMGIGLNIYWVNAIIGYNLDGVKFPISLQEYKEKYKPRDENTLLIPLSRDRGHFSETIFDKELMTPYSDEPAKQPVTRLTLGALSDLGWNIDLNKAEEIV